MLRNSFNDFVFEHQSVCLRYQHSNGSTSCELWPSIIQSNSSSLFVIITSNRYKLHETSWTYNDPSTNYVLFIHIRKKTCSLRSRRTAWPLHDLFEHATMTHCKIAGVMSLPHCTYNKPIQLAGGIVWLIANPKIGPLLSRYWLVVQRSTLSF